MDIKSLLNLEKIEIEDPLIQGFFNLDNKRPYSNNFIFSNFRVFFARNNFIIKNSPKFVWPKYICKSSYNGRSQLVRSNRSFENREKFFEILSNEILERYIEVFITAHQLEDNLGDTNILEFAQKHNIEAIVNFFIDRNVNKLIQNFYSLVYLYVDEYKFVTKLGKRYYLILDHFFNIYRGDNKIIPIFVYTQKEKLKRIPIDYTICFFLNIFVFFKKIFK